MCVCVLLLLMKSLAKTMPFPMLEDAGCAHGVTLVDPHWMRPVERPRDPTMRQALASAPMNREAIRDGMTQASAAAVEAVISAQHRTIARLMDQLKEEKDARATAEAALAASKRNTTQLALVMAARVGFVHSCWHNKHWTNDEAVRQMADYTASYRRLHAGSQDQ